MRHAWTDTRELLFPVRRWRCGGCLAEVESYARPVAGEHAVWVVDEKDRDAAVPGMLPDCELEAARAVTES